MFLPHPRVKLSIVGSLREREVACSALDRHGRLEFRILGITVSPTEPPGTVDPIGDVMIDNILPFKGYEQNIFAEFTK